MIDLQNLQNAYELNLCNRAFHYKLSNNTDIDIVFYKENLCHLLGLQHIFGNDRHYLGKSGYEQIKNNLLTTKDLKKHNEKQYNFIKIKLKHFNEIIELMKNCSIVRFYPDRCFPHTRIEADFLLYKDNQRYMLHLFAVREHNTKQYSPRSFIVKTNGDKNYTQFTDNQEYKKIIERNIIERND